MHTAPSAPPVASRPWLSVSTDRTRCVSCHAISATFTRIAEAPRVGPKRKQQYSSRALGYAWRPRKRKSKNYSLLNSSSMCAIRDGVLALHLIILQLPKLRELARYGLPAAVRGQVWTYLLGVSQPIKCMGNAKFMINVDALQRKSSLRSRKCFLQQAGQLQTRSVLQEKCSRLFAVI